MNIKTINGSEYDFVSPILLMAGSNRSRKIQM